jgi:hypothetical protein
MPGGGLRAYRAEDFGCNFFETTRRYRRHRRNMKLKFNPLSVSFEALFPPVPPVLLVVRPIMTTRRYRRNRRKKKP